MLNFNSLYLSVLTNSNLIPIFDASCSIRMMPPSGWMRTTARPFLSVFNVVLTGCPFWSST